MQVAANTGSPEQGLRKVGAKVAAVLAALAAGYLLTLSPVHGVAQRMLDQQVDVGPALHELGSSAADLRSSGEDGRP